MYKLSCGFSRPSRDTDGVEEFVDDPQGGGRSHSILSGISTEKVRRKALWKSVRRLKQVRSILTPKLSEVYAKTETRAIQSACFTVTKNRPNPLNSRKRSQEEFSRGKTRCSTGSQKKVSSETPVNNNYAFQRHNNRTPPTTATTVWSLSSAREGEDYDEDESHDNYNETVRTERQDDCNTCLVKEEPSLPQPTDASVEHVSLNTPQSIIRSPQQSSILDDPGSLSNGRKRPLSPVLKRPDSPAGSFTSTSNRSPSLEYFKTPQPIKMEEFPPICEEEAKMPETKINESVPTTAPNTSPVTITTSEPVTPAKHTKTNEAELLASKLESFKVDYAELIKVADHHDCKVPHSILENLQKDILDTFRGYSLTPRFLIQAYLTIEQRGTNKPSTNSVIMSASDISKMANRSARIDNVLAEPYMKFFIQASESSSPTRKPKNLTAVEKIDGFINEIHTGPFSGRVPVGSALKGIQDFPVVMYGSGNFDLGLEAGVKSNNKGAARWQTFCESFCPIIATVLLEPTTSSKKSTDKTLDNDDVRRNLEQIGLVLADMLSNWRCHRLRIFTILAEKHQLLVPSIESISQTDMKKAGWNEMKFGDENLIRWKCIREGVLLSYLSGSVETSLDKALALVYDGDTHKNWIPFLTETERIFGLAPFLFSFGYGVSLPWPLNRRELIVLGMATDALRLPGVSSIQMWGTHIPDAATTVFGVPVKKATPGCVCLELPVLSFFLSPLSENKTQVRMLAAVDVKLNIVPSALQTYMAKHMATKMFKNVQKLCKDFDKTEYPDVIKQNQELFDKLLTGVDIAVEDIAKTKSTNPAKESSRKRVN